MKTTSGLLAFVLLVVMSACSSSDPTTSDEYAALQQQLAETETMLATSVAEESATAIEPSERRERAAAILGEIKVLLDDPQAFGIEEEVADLLATHATPDALMDDDVFGAVGYRTGFYNTLYAGAVDAAIDVHHTWVSQDGSQGGVLWTWHGTNAAGNPFELAGISLTTHNEEGLISSEFVTYPYPDAYVDEAVFGDGT